jgi:hypothetical protein
VFSLCVSLPKKPEGHSAPTEAVHTGIYGGMSVKASDYSCVPLCSDCHTHGSLAYHRIGKRAFERVHSVRFPYHIGHSK